MGADVKSRAAQFDVMQTRIGACARMRKIRISKAFTLIESGPVVLVTTHDGTRPHSLRSGDITDIFDILR
jgi:hypothetical protein